MRANLLRASLALGAFLSSLGIALAGTVPTEQDCHDAHEKIMHLASDSLSLRSSLLARESNLLDQLFRPGKYFNGPQVPYLTMKREELTEARASTSLKADPLDQQLEQEVKGLHECLNRMKPELAARKASPEAACYREHGPGVAEKYLEVTQDLRSWQEAEEIFLDEIFEYKPGSDLPVVQNAKANLIQLRQERTHRFMSISDELKRRLARLDDCLEEAHKRGVGEKRNVKNEARSLSAVKDVPEAGARGESAPAPNARAYGSTLR